LGRLVTADTSSPLTTVLIVLVREVGLGRADESGELTLILALDVLDAENGSSLLVNDRSETSLALDDDIRDTHFAAKSRKENDKLNGVNVVGDDDE
jgi:hypothetical protein